MTLYDILVKLAANGYDKIYIDLVNKTLKIGKQIVVENAEIKRYKIKVGDDEYEFDDLINNLMEINPDDLYKQYKYSVPSEKNNGKHYFKALPAEEMTDAQLVTGMNRLEAKIRLEAFILMYGIEKNHYIMIDNMSNQWYWQSKVDPDFVVLKKYI